MASVLSIKVLMDVKDAVTNLKGMGDSTSQAESKLTGMQNAAKSALPAAVALSSGVVALGKSAIESGAAAQAAANDFAATFGSTTAIAQQSAQVITESTGLSQQSYDAMATSIGQKLQTMGIDQATSAEMTQQLIQKGADLAATFGGDTSDAVAKLTKGLDGSTKGMKVYGITVDSSASATDNYKAIMDQTTATVGAYTDEAGETEHQQEQLTSKWQNATAQLGQSLQPAVTAVSNALIGLVEWVSNNTTTVGILGGAVLGVTAALTAMSVASKVVAAAQTAMKIAQTAATAAQWLFNAAMSANPLGLIVIAITAVIAAIVLMVTHWDSVKAAVSSVVSWVVDKWNWVMSKIRPIIDAIGGIAGSIAGFLGFSAVGDGVVTWHNSYPAGAGVMTAAADISTIGRVSSRLGGTDNLMGQQVNIEMNFNGIVGDPVAVGDQVEYALYKATGTHVRYNPTLEGKRYVTEANSGVMLATRSYVVNVNKQGDDFDPTTPVNRLGIGYQAGLN